MDTGLKLQFAVIAASGAVVALLGGLLAAFSQQLTPAAMRFLITIPPLSVAAFSFVFAFVRDRGGELPGLSESAATLALATLVAALLFALMSAGMLLFVRLGARFF